MCRNRSYDCQWLAERASNPRVRDILLDMARTWTRLALEAEDRRRDSSPKSRLAKKDATKDRPRVISPNPLPLPASPRSIARSQPLRDDPFQPHLAGVLEDRLTAVVLQVLV